MSEPIVVFTTCASEEEAVQIANALVGEHLAACVNILSPVQSIYQWEGKIWNEKEWLLLIKTVRNRFEELKVKIMSLHSYSVPEMLCLPIVEASIPYLEWLEEMTKG